LIVEEAATLERHEQLLRSAGYRPPGGCPKCVGPLHVHDYRLRVLLADPVGIVTVVRFLCYSCGATWQMLPAFVARHLWRSWPVVEDAVEPSRPPPSEPPPPTGRTEIPTSTRRRWFRRLAASAALLVVTIATGERPALTALAGTVGLDGTRHELVEAYAQMAAVAAGHRLTELAALIHRLAPGVRLM
jgi:hypothetical protein